MIPIMVASKLPSLPLLGFTRVPATPREAWLWLAALVALNSIVMSLRTQAIDIAVLTGLLWAGAFLCLEDKLASLKPAPTAIGLLVGSLLLLFSFWRSAQMFHADVVAYGLLPLQGLGLALLLMPPTQLWNLKAPLLVLMSMAGVLLLPLALPIEFLSKVTAQVTGAILMLIGSDPYIVGNEVWLSGGGVRIAGPCSGKDMIAQLFSAATIFLLAFPLRQRWLSWLVLAASPLIAIVANAGRIALLALFNASSLAEKKWWFDFFHESEGSLIFAAISMTIFAWGYLKLIERQLAAREMHHA
jgi:exosortase/archaeosortase family protein